MAGAFEKQMRDLDALIDQGTAAMRNVKSHVERTWQAAVEAWDKANARSKDIDERERKCAAREKNFNQLRMEISAERVKTLAALERETTLAAKLCDTRKELGAANAQLTKLRACFPQLFVEAPGHE